ncbi:MAG: stage III sporulation protein AF [Bacillota bacterium]
MDTLRVLVQNLIIIVVLSVLLEMLLPGGEMRRYSRMVLGLMVIVAVIQAASGITGGGLFREVEEYAWRSGPDAAQRLDILEKGRELEAAGKIKALDQYRKGIERQVSALAGMDSRVRLAAVDVRIQNDPSKKDFGRITEVELVLSGGEGQKDSDIKPVETVSVAVGQEKSTSPGGGKPPPEYAEAAKSAAARVANFYNLSPEQIKVRFN